MVVRSDELTPGAVVLVKFVDGVQRLPIVTHLTPKDKPGFLPVEMALNATSKVRELRAL